MTPDTKTARLSPRRRLFEMPETSVNQRLAAWTVVPSGT